jgi:hypothetical protein
MYRIVRQTSLTSVCASDTEMYRGRGGGVNMNRSKRTPLCLIDNFIVPLSLIQTTSWYPFSFIKGQSRVVNKGKIHG